MTCSSHNAILHLDNGPFAHFPYWFIYLFIYSFFNQGYPFGTDFQRDPAYNSSSSKEGENLLNTSR